MGTSRLLALLLLFAVPCVGQRNGHAAAFNPEDGFHPGKHKKLILQTESEMFVAEDTGTHVRMSRTPRAGPEASVNLPSEIVQVQEIHKAGDRFIVLGRVNAVVYEVVILRLPSMSVEDVFWCYKPSVSPDGLNVAYLKFYPPHFTEGTEDHYMVYDLMKSPGANRPEGVAQTDKINVGRTLFPPNSSNSEYDNVRRDQPSHTAAMKRFFWSEDSRLLVFADRFKNALTLVRARKDAALGTFKLSGTVDVSGKVCSEAPQSPCYFLLTAITFRGSEAHPIFSPLSGAGSTKSFSLLVQDQ